MILEALQVGPLQVNCYIVGCEESREGVVIDAGGDAEEILARVGKLGLSIRYLLSTHGHFDHVGGNRAVLAATGAEFLIHERDSYFLSRAAESGRDFGVETENSPEPDRFLEDGMQLEFGSHCLEVIHTPGHSPGGCCLWCEAERVVFTGDTLFNGSIGRFDLPGGNPSLLARSIRERLYALPDDTRVCPGHGTWTTIGHERLHNPHVRGSGAAGKKE
jgi:glyoxylase-like metal-dependent hydrolase (beta-lactamase superfamily II)